MKLRAHEASLVLEKCHCGGMPCVHTSHLGQVRLYFVSCIKCGHDTDPSESYAEPVSEWNEGATESQQEQAEKTENVKASLSVPSVASCSTAHGSVSEFMSFG